MRVLAAAIALGLVTGRAVGGKGAQTQRRRGSPARTEPQAADPGPPGGPGRIFVVAICVAAALRAFFFCAACPLFNNVDEQAHLDLVLRYSHGQVPSSGLVNFGREAAELIVLYGTPEYLAAKGASSDLPPPPWTWPGVKESPEFERTVDAWTHLANHEAASFPSFYVLAGAWCWMGRGLGFRDGRLAYWIRFLNVPLIALLVWVSHLIGAEFFPARPALRLGLPLLVAFHPQDIFHSINPDALSPLLFATSLLLLLFPARRDRGLAWQVMTGLAIAATFLVKPSNIALAVVLGIAVFWDCRQAVRAGELAKGFGRMSVLLVSAGAPIAAWLIRNWILLGSLTGAGEKLKFLTWTLKPFGQWWDHPLFTLPGAEGFLAEVTRTFWRGEIVWYRAVVAHGTMDWFYLVSSAVLLLVSLATLVLARKREPEGSRIIGSCFVAVAVSLLLMVTISVAYDFGRCPFPSRASPYLVAGRLVSGVLVPFLVLYLDGLDRLLARARPRWIPLLVVGAVVVSITCSELVLVQPMLGSSYNWFHMSAVSGPS